jgi:protein gp37
MREIVGHPSFQSNVSGCAGIAPIPWPLPNVWLGVSVENQHFADERIPLLLQTPAAVRFISAEPLLGPIELERGGFALHRPVKSPSGTRWPGLDWVIVGGESGSKARPFDLAWARSIVAQCKAAGVPVFVKQLGSNPTCEHCGDAIAVFGPRNRKGGDINEFPQELRVREFPKGAA